MKLIGEFAKDNNVTIRALHHYEKLGLITPTKVDVYTGYRYYDDSQSMLIQGINMYKELGFSLSEIKSLLIANNTSQLVEKLLIKQRQAAIDLAGLENRYKDIVGILNALEQNNDDHYDIEEVLEMKDNNRTTNLDKHEKFRQLAIELFENAKKNNYKLCAIAADIDNFLQVNEKYGRDVGDIVLDRVSNALINVQTLFNKDNDKSYSIMEQTGDEYHIIINDTVSNCKIIAEAMLHAVSNIDYNDIAENLTTSITIGIVDVDKCDRSTNYLFHLADTALYDAKVNNKGGYGIY